MSPAEIPTRAPGDSRQNKIVVCDVVHTVDLDNIADDLPGWAMLLADAEGALVALEANHQALSAEHLDQLAERHKKLPEYKLRAKVRIDPQHLARQIGIAEVTRSVVFLRAIVGMLLANLPVEKT